MTNLKEDYSNIETGLTTSLLHAFRIAAVLVQNQAADPAFVVPGKFKLRVDVLVEEQGLRFGKDRELRLLTELGEQFAFFEGDDDRNGPVRERQFIGSH